MKKPTSLFKPLSDTKANRLLIFLLVIDIVFIIIHYINALTPLLNNDKFSIGIDGGYAEFFQYFKFASIVVLLILVLKKTGMQSFLAWIMIFFYLLVDDSVRIHDRFGSYVAMNLDFNPPFGLRLLDIGELLVSACAALILIPVIIYSYLKGNSLFKKISENLILLLCLMVFFGVGMDMIHMMIIDKVPDNLLRGINSILGLIEDGGEMVSASLILWYCYFLYIKDGEPGMCVRNLFIREIPQSV